MTNPAPFALALLISACGTVSAPSNQISLPQALNESSTPRTNHASQNQEDSIEAILQRAEREGQEEAKRQTERQSSNNGIAGFSNNSTAPRQTKSAPRKIFVGARSNDPTLAVYLERWSKSLEKTGNTYYPEQARQQKLHGSVQVTIEIDVKGKLGSIEINRSSGHSILDEAVHNIIKRAAPFEPLPPEISRKTDIISITRTWTFTTDNILKEKTTNAEEH